MPRKYSKSASKDVERAMRKRKRGTLKSGRSGKKVTRCKATPAFVPRSPCSLTRRSRLRLHRFSHGGGKRPHKWVSAKAASSRLADLHFVAEFGRRSRKPTPEACRDAAEDRQLVAGLIVDLPELHAH